MNRDKMLVVIFPTQLAVGLLVSESLIISQHTFPRELPGILHDLAGVHKVFM